MLRSKFLKGLVISFEELGERLKPWEATGFIEDCRRTNGAKRTFCSCGHEDSKFSENSHQCPKCGGVLLEKNYDSRSCDIVVGRINGDSFELYRLSYTLEHVMGDSMYDVPIEETFVGEIKRDTDGSISDYEWGTLQNWKINKNSMDLLLEFFSRDHNYKTLSWLMQNFTKVYELEYLKMVVIGLIKYPLIINIDNLNRYPNFFRCFLHFSINEFTIPTITCLGKTITRDFPIPSSCTMEKLLEAYGFPECIYSQMDVTFGSKREINDVDATRRFVKTPLGIIALNRLQNGIIDLTEFFKMQEVEYAISNNIFCNKTTCYYDSSSYYKTKENDKLFLPEEAALFFGYFKDSIDRYDSMRRVVENFSEHINCLKQNGIVPNVDNIRDRPFNEFLNSSRCKTLKNTCLEDLMKTNPLEALSRMRGFL